MVTRLQVVRRRTLIPGPSQEYERLGSRIELWRACQFAAHCAKQILTGQAGERRGCDWKCRSAFGSYS